MENTNFKDIFEILYDFVAKTGKNIAEKGFKENLKDLGDGIYDTLVKAPYAIGDFIARATGLRDFQYQTGDYYKMQAKNEINLILLTIRNPKIAKIVGKSLAKEFKENPCYFIGGIFSAKNIEKIFGKTYSKGIIPTAKIDAKINEIINEDGFKEIYDFLNNLEKTGEFDVLGNTWNKILDFYGNYDDVFEYYSKTPFRRILDDTSDYFKAWNDLLSDIANLKNPNFSNLQKTNSLQTPTFSPKNLIESEITKNSDLSAASSDFDKAVKQQENLLKGELSFTEKYVIKDFAYKLYGVKMPETKQRIGIDAATQCKISLFLGDISKHKRQIVQTCGEKTWQETFENFQKTNDLKVFENAVKSQNSNENVNLQNSANLQISNENANLKNSENNITNPQENGNNFKM